MSNVKAWLLVAALAEGADEPQIADECIAEAERWIRVRSSIDRLRRRRRWARQNLVIERELDGLERERLRRN